MPNGGGDCCGTCWFNAKNKGKWKVGHEHAEDPEPDVCIIRQLDITNPFYTYCANHPRKNPNKIRIPIGPVYTGDSSGYREPWVDSPDTEEVRINLLNLLHTIGEQRTEGYPSGFSFEESIILQLVAFQDIRAIPDLERISKFNPKLGKGKWIVLGKGKRISRSQATLILVANEAIKQIQGDPNPIVLSPTFRRIAPPSR